MHKLFLSHSSSDREKARRLATDLKERQIDVWLDEWEIEVGESIVAATADALKEARFVGVLLSKHSVRSGWVTQEWQAKIWQQIQDKKVYVLPLLAEDCEIPTFLADKRYADFSTSWKSGLDDLTRTLRRRRSRAGPDLPDRGERSVTDYTRKFLGDLEEAQIPFPTLGNLKLIRSLRAIPRSGKLLRLESMVPKIPIRSVYDHLLSVAHSADCLLPEVAPNLDGRDYVDLARVIAYHDLCEVIIGDIPQYTKLNRSKRSRARVAAETRLSQLPSGEPERITNEFIGMFLNPSERASLKRAQEVLSGKTALKNLFYALDKIDPIIAIWRYIMHFRGDGRFRIDEFIDRTRHFFENPQVRPAVARNSSDMRMVELVDRLQDPFKAKQYFEDAALLEDQLFAFPAEVVRHLIEGRELSFVLPRGQRLSTAGRARSPVK